MLLRRLDQRVRQPDDCPQSATSSSRRRRSAAAVLRGRGRRFSRPSRITSPSLRTRITQGTRAGRPRARAGPASADACADCGRRVGASRASRRSASLRPRHEPKRRSDQGLRAHRHFTGSAGLIGERRFVLATLPSFLEADDVLRRRPRSARESPRRRRKWMPEQPVVGRAPLGRRRERRQSGLADVSRLRGPSSSIAARKARWSARARRQSCWRAAAPRRKRRYGRRAAAASSSYHAAASAMSASSRAAR